MLGPSDGFRLGLVLGRSHHAALGARLGMVVGSIEGTVDGLADGTAYVPVDGTKLGLPVGIDEGELMIAMTDPNSFPRTVSCWERPSDVWTVQPQAHCLVKSLVGRWRATMGLPCGSWTDLH